MKMPRNEFVAANYLWSFFLFFLCLLSLETSLMYIPFPPFELLFDGYYEALCWLADFVLNSVFGLHLAFVREFNGSTDRVIDMFKYSLFALCSLPGGAYLAKSARARGLALEALVFCLAIVQISYGSGKLMGMQFGFPSEFRLTEELGNMTPMRLMWTFLGTSWVFKGFIAISQICAGVLITPLKTRMMGALLSLVLFANIFVMNIAFDAPLKVFSLSMVGASAFVIFTSPQFKAFANSLFGGRPLRRKDYVLLGLFLIVVITNYVQRPSEEAAGAIRGEFSIQKALKPESVERLVFDGGNRVKVIANGRGIYFPYNKANGSYKIEGFKDKFGSEAVFEIDGGELRLSFEGGNAVYILKNPALKMLRTPTKLLNEFPKNESESFKRRKYR